MYLTYDARHPGLRVVIDDIEVSGNRVLALHVLHLVEFACLLADLHIGDAGQGLLETGDQVSGVRLGKEGGEEGVHREEGALGGQRGGQGGLEGEFGQGEGRCKREAV